MLTTNIPPGPQRFSGLTPRLHAAFDFAPALIQKLNGPLSKKDRDIYETALAKRIREHLVSSDSPEKVRKTVLYYVSRISTASYTPTEGGPVEKLLLEYSQFTR